MAGGGTGAVDEYRGRCLWFLRRDYYPEAAEEAEQVLRYVERYGDLEAFRRAARIRPWLSPSSSATFERGPDEVVIQWTRDSAYRFFPLVEHEELGLTLHAFDLATNKLLAVVGRSEPRDLVDALACHEGLQPLGYLAWAACGKDPGFSPRAILEHAAGSTRYAGPELAGLAFEGAPPDPADLLRRWRAALRSAPEVVDRLPPEHAGKAVLDRQGRLFRGEPAELEAALASEGLVFHEGAIRGAFPRLVR